MPGLAQLIAAHEVHVAPAEHVEDEALGGIRQLDQAVLVAVAMGEVELLLLRLKNMPDFLAIILVLPLWAARRSPACFACTADRKCDCSSPGTTLSPQP